MQPDARCSPGGEAACITLLELVVAPLYSDALFTEPLPARQVTYLVDRLLDLVADRPPPHVGRREAS